jgi:hypothetical protein
VGNTNEMRGYMKTFLFGLGIFGLVLWVVTWIALYAMTGYIIWHFVTKFW